jgi:hypothetical protein
MMQQPQSKTAQSAEPVAVINTNPLPVGDSRPSHSEKPFLVIVLDEADSSCSYGVVRAKDEEAAECKAVDERKEDHDLEDLDDEEAGFQALATFSRDDILYILGEMDGPSA